jgi:hypothetical protein
VSQLPVLTSGSCRTFVPLTYRLSVLVPATGFGPLEYLRVRLWMPADAALTVNEVVAPAFQ